MEQRQHGQRHVIFTEPDHVTRCDSVHHHVGLGQLGAFRATRGAGGIEDHRGLVRHGLDGIEDRRLAGHGPSERSDAFALHRRCGCRIDRSHDHVFAARHVLEAVIDHLRNRQVWCALKGNDGYGVAVLEVIGDLAALEEHVEGHDRRAGFKNGVIGNGEIRQVWAGEGDLVAPLHAQFAQAIGQLVGCAVELGIGQLRVIENDRQLSRVRPGAGL